MNNYKNTLDAQTVQIAVYFWHFFWFFLFLKEKNTFKLVLLSTPIVQLSIISGKLPQKSKNSPQKVDCDVLLFWLW